MKQLKDIITEKLRLDKNLKRTYTCQPKNLRELRSIIKERLVKDKDDDLNDINVSQIIDMGWLFANLDPHNIKIDKWDVSNVKDMYGMFYGCTKFNCDLSKWDVSKLEDMRSMFYGCENFEGNGLENWDVSNVKSINYIFNGCDSLKKIPDWYKVV